MKCFAKVMLAWMLVLCLMPVTAGAFEIKGFADKIRDALVDDLATNDGLTVKSPEQFLEVDPCTDITHEGGNWYKYTYANKGLKWKSHGDPTAWKVFETYVDMLVDTGYYKLLEHGKPDDDVEFWCLGYTGSGSVKKTFKVGYTNTYAAIVVRCNLGDAEVYFSLDITADDLDETQARLGKSIGLREDGKDVTSTKDGNTKCTYCDGDGKCNRCDGKGSGFQNETEYVNGLPVTKSVYKACYGSYCDNGKCSMCGGDGRR